jgi:uncharacterized protein YndB with AHSA1/START domain
MTVRDSFAVRAPIDKVFDLLADPRWLTGTDAAPGVRIWHDGGPERGVGSRFLMEGPRSRGRWASECIEFVPPTALVLHVSREGDNRHGTTSYHLEAIADGTQVLLRGDGFFGITDGVVLRLLSPLFRGYLRGGSRRLARAIEERAALTY